MVNGEDNPANAAKLRLIWETVALPEPSPEPHDWYLFNDFAVQKISTEEALHFEPSFKTPVILAYQVRCRRDSDVEGQLIDYRKLDDNWKVSLDPSCLYDAGSLYVERLVPLSRGD